MRVAAQDRQPPGRAGHRDVAVDGAFDAVAEPLRVDQHDEVELQPLGGHGRQGTHPRTVGEARVADDAGRALVVGREPLGDQGVPLRDRPVQHLAAGTDGGGHVDVRQHRPDDRLRRGHDRLGGAVVDGQRRVVHPLDADAREPLLPRLDEPVAGLRAVADDRETA